MSEYCVRYVDLPCTAKGVTVQDEDGFYNIYINSLLSSDEQEKALAHELRHVYAEDFDDGKPIEAVEPYHPYRPEPLMPPIPHPVPHPVPPPAPGLPEWAAAPAPPVPDPIVSCGQLIAFAVKLECGRARIKPWKLDKAQLDIWADELEK